MTPYPAYKDSGIEWLGEIPAGWGVKKLKYVSNLIIDGTHFTPTYVDKGIPFLRVTDIQTSSIDFDTIKYISTEEHCKLTKRCEPEKGDLLLSKNGTIGITKVVDWDFPFSIYVSLCLIKFIKQLISPYFFSYFFQSNVVNEQIFQSSKTTSVTNLHLDKIRELLTIAPPLPEQRDIAAFLDHKTRLIDTYVAKKQQQVERLLAYRVSLINQAVTKGLNPDAPMKDSGIEWLGEIPAGWKMLKFKHITKFLNGYAFNADGYVQEGVPLIRIGDIKAELDLSACKKVPYSCLETQKAFKIYQGDILLALTGATIGKNTVFDIEHDALLNQRVAIIRPKKQRLGNEFLKYIIDSDSFRKHILFECDGGAQANIGKSEIGEFNVVLPPLPEQRAIATYLNEQTAKIDTLIAATQRQIERLQAYRASLISDAVTGKIDVREELQGLHISKDSFEE